MVNCMIGLVIETILTKGIGESAKASFDEFWSSLWQTETCKAIIGIETLWVAKPHIGSNTAKTSAIENHTT